MRLDVLRGAASASAGAPAERADAREGAPSGDRREAVRRAAADPGRLLAAADQSLRFDVDPQTGRVVLRVLDARTQEVVRQIPAEEVLRIARVLAGARGLVLRERA